MPSLSAGVGWGWEGRGERGGRGEGRGRRGERGGEGKGRRGERERGGRGRRREGRETGCSLICCNSCCHRDETLLIHSAYEQILSAAANKGERKKVAEVQEMAAQAIQHA